MAANPLTLAEVLVGPAAAGLLDTAADALEVLGVGVVELAIDAPARLAELRVATGLKLPDCCVLLAAEQSDATVATFDSRLAAAAATMGFDVLS